MWLRNAFPKFRVIVLRFLLRSSRPCRSCCRRRITDGSTAQATSGRFMGGVVDTCLHLTGVPLTGVHLTGVHPASLPLSGVHVTGVHPSHGPNDKRVMKQWQQVQAKRLWERFDKVIVLEEQKRAQGD